jgi:hypothetical protein
MYCASFAGDSTGGEPKSLFWACIRIAFILSAITLWIIEHGKVNELKRIIEKTNEVKAPDFHAEFSAVLTGGRKDTSRPGIVMASLLITNPRGPASAAWGYTMSIVLIDGQIIVGRLVPFSGKDFSAPAPNGQTIISPSETYLPRTLSEPIDSGGLREGWLMAAFDQKVIDSYNEQKGFVRVQFKDAITNSLYSFDSKLAGGFAMAGLPEL